MKISFLSSSENDDVVEQTDNWIALLLKQISALNYSRCPSFVNLEDLIQVRMAEVHF